MPSRCVGDRGKYWLLLATFYSLVTPGRKWERVSVSLLTNLLGLEVVVDMPQMFQHVVGGHLQVIVAKYVDDMFIAVKTNHHDSIIVSSAC
eukprot:IDg21321t1